MTTEAAKKLKEPLYVNICEAEPNPMFTEEQRSWVRFLIYNRKVACAECGKESKKMWTMLLEFRASTLGEGTFVVPKGDKVHPPLTPVCEDHPLSPEIPE